MLEVLYPQVDLQGKPLYHVYPWFMSLLQQFSDLAYASHVPGMIKTQLLI